MKPTSNRLKTEAFTLLELLVIIGILLILFAMLMPPPGPVKARQIICLNNQKQIAMALLIWKSDHNEHFPWQLSVTNDGTAEFIAGGEVIPHFRVLSNYVKRPIIFSCPADPTRRWPAATLFPDNTNHSYFVATDSGANDSANILTGDRNLWSNGKPVRPGLFIYSAGLTLDWTSTIHHNSRNQPVGNLSFADGHALTYRGPDLNAAFHREGLATNHLAVP